MVLCFYTVLYLFIKDVTNVAFFYFIVLFICLLIYFFGGGRVGSSGFRIPHTDQSHV